MKRDSGSCAQVLPDQSYKHILNVNVGEKEKRKNTDFKRITTHRSVFLVMRNLVMGKVRGESSEEGTRPTRSHDLVSAQAGN